jgi:hypothetical protein
MNDRCVRIGSGRRGGTGIGVVSRGTSGTGPRFKNCVFGNASGSFRGHKSIIFVGFPAARLRTIGEM